MEFLTSNWLYFVFVALMVFMMFKRGGCCGGHSNDSHSDNESSKAGGCCDSHKKGN